MAGRFLGHDPALGLTEAFHVDNDVRYAIETIQDVEPILENNKKLATAGDGYSPSRDIRRIANIPNVIIEKWINEGICNVFDKNDAPKLRRLLNDPDWRHLRTSPGRY